jgi:hypothetical protein
MPGMLLLHLFDITRVTSCTDKVLAYKCILVQTEKGLIALWSPWFAERAWELSPTHAVACNEHTMYLAGCSH